MVATIQGDIVKLKQDLDVIKADIAKAKESNHGVLSNKQKRVFYARNEILKIRFEDLKNENTSTPVTEVDISNVTALSNELNLSYVRYGGSILIVLIEKVDELLRFVGVWSCIIIGAVFLAIPSIIIKQLDYFLLYRGIISPFNQFSVLAKRFLNYAVLALSGISLVVDGMDLNYFGSSCVLTCFSHSSTMDAFILSFVIPTRQYTVCKKDLFLIPFFAWLMIAFDGVPIDRSNITSASQSLTNTAENAQKGDCLCMAPEGTRTKTGQLIAFKKGPFYVWEKLQTDIIPIVVFGGYELYPSGKQMTIPGRVYVRVLPPITSSEAKTREEMSRLLRLKMLEAFLDSPDEAGQSLTWPERRRNILALMIQFTVNFALYKACEFIFFDYFGLKLQSAIILFFLYTVITTVILYFYAFRLTAKKSPTHQKKL
jgi:1-acyl-sn-glycerol-3-phosphate acyltransferase